MRTELIVFLLTATVSLIFSSPNYPLFLFSPFLVFIFYRCSLIGALWWTLAAGIVLSIPAGHLHFGFIPFSLLVTTFLLYERKQHFFYDNLTTFPIMTTLYSLIYTFILALLAGIPFSLGWVASDLILMPLIDGCFSFAAYTLPLIYFGKKRRSGEEYFS